ncbi:hypothetical protein IFO70_00085 [Phormidium tenue FACHB-886]|nr:hypothetical protein [Phormidium tenue FACHB-886]
MTAIDVAHLAQDKGCTFRMQTAEGAPLYWVENSYFISRPFSRLNELAQFVQKLPVFLGDTAVHS